MLTIHVSSRFKRSYKRMPKSVQNDFIEKIDIFRNQPFHPALKSHKLSGQLADYFSFYLRDGHRVLFDFVAPDLALLVNIGSHDDYKKWARS